MSSRRRPAPGNNPVSDRKKRVIPGWRKAYKSLAVILPAIGFIVIQAADAISATQGIGLVPEGWQRHFGFLYVVLAFIGRIINQGDILGEKGKK